MIRWITETIGTGAFQDVSEVSTEFAKIDVRGLVDGQGNGQSAIRKIIDLSIDRINAGQKVVVCCDYGRSRSNAIAAAVLATCNNIPLATAIRHVCDAVAEAKIDVRFLKEVERAMGALQNDDATPITSEFIILGNSPLAPLVKDSLLDHNHSAKLIPQDHLKQTQLYSEVTSARCTVIVDLTQPVDFNSTESIGQRVSSTKDLVEICLTTKTRLVHCSSFEVFDRYTTSGLIADETTPRHPRNNFGVACTLSETIIEDAIRFDNLNATVLRMSRVFGPHHDSRRLPMRFFAMVNEGLPIDVHQCLNGAPALDLLYETDAVTAIVAAARSDSPGVFNVGTGVLTATQRIAEMYSTILRSDNKIQLIEVNRLASNIALNSHRASQHFGWQAAVGLKEALEQIAAFSTGNKQHELQVNSQTSGLTRTSFRS